MNILIIAHFQNDGSPYVSFVHDQALAYKALGHNVYVISPVVCNKKEAEVYKGKKEKYIDGIRVFYPRYLSISKYGRYGINAFLGFYSVNKIVKKIINGFHPDIIHAHTIGFDGAISVRLKEKYNIPVSITAHGSDVVIPIEDKKLSYIISICRRANTVVTVSSKLKNILIKEAPDLNVQVILNGFNNQYCSEVPKKKHSIIQVSNLIEQKKVDITLKAVATLYKEYRDVTLTVIGDGPEKNHLKELCTQLNISDIVNFTGQISNCEVLKRMSETEVFIMPSIKEGLGIVYLEAMASGCLTIGTRGEGIEDIIKNKVNGFLIEADNIEMIITYVRSCFENTEYNKLITQNGKESVKVLTWETNAKKYTSLFEEII
ncbi:glycosyltransferase [Mobilitalea sibirica]|uniref:Glycosyltransferase n=1 Tax=Mobilitalea sibirica TaxID=1462919 RepID=A0A8J7KXP7_9FIRM|nr:glycosyltransferase [Mobilitalea sibirica]MBH1942057.1 glycosyltransferase [Mobilitalea sibirica]